jgi:hypothetical protein
MRSRFQSAICNLQSAILGAALVLASPAWAGQAFPGGVLDPSGKAAYVAGEKGIDAVDLATGAARWRSSHAQRPLFVAGDQLFALSLGKKEMHVVGLDLTNRGVCTYRSKAVPVARWIVPVGDPSHTFTVNWRREGRSLILTWHARTTTRPGKSTSGQSRIDLVDGTVEAERVDSASPPRVLPRVLERLAVRWYRSIGDQLYAVTEEELPGGKRRFRLALRRWDERTGKQGRSHKLIEGGRPVLMKGLDGLHLWVRDAGGLGDAPTPWLVYSSLDGQLVGRVPFVPGTIQGVVVSGRAYCLVSRSGRMLLDGPSARSYALVSARANSDKPLWTWPLSLHAASSP